MSEAPIRPPGSGLPPPRPYHQLHLWQFQAVRDVLVVGAVVGLIWLGYALRAVTIPLLVALLLAYLFEPFIERLMRQPRLQMDRLRAVTLILILVIGAIVVTLAIVLPLAIGQGVRLVSSFSNGTLYTQMARVEPHVPDFLDEEFENLLHIFPKPPGAERDVDRQEELPAAGDGEGGVEGDAAEATVPGEPIDEARVRAIVAEEVQARAAERPNVLGIAGRGAEAVADLIGTVVGIGLLAFLIPFYFFFFSLWYPDVLAFGRRMLPKKNEPRALELIGKMDRVVSAFVRGRIVIATIMGAMLAIGWLICGVPYAIVLGLVAGAFSLVPYLVGVALPIAIALLFFEQIGLPPEQRDIWLGWFGVFLWPSLVYVFVQFIETYILTPKIAGKATGLDPVTVVVAVLAGGSLLGLYGMLLAIPLAACLKIIITDVIAPRVDQWLKGERPDPLPIERGD